MTCAYPSLGDWGGHKPAAAEDLAAAQAEELAWNTMLSLSAGQITVCPITVRPIFDRRYTYPTWLTSPVGTWPGSGYELYRLPEDAALYYGLLGTGTRQQAIVHLERPVGDVVAVTIDGATIDPSHYRVDQGALVRTDGQLWPVMNDLLAPSGATGVFEVTYFRGYRPSSTYLLATGILALEYYRTLTNKSTRLPERVTNVTRQGVTYQVPSTLFDDGRTGIREVDDVLRRINPNGLKTASVVMSPDTIRSYPRQIG